MRWDPKAQHEQMIHEYGYRTANFNRTFDCYDYVDCFNYMDVHDLLKLYKHGFSKVTDHVSREIRHGRLTREEGLSLVQRYEHVPLEYEQQFCEWLGIKPRSLQLLMNLHRNRQFWNEVSPGQWEFKGLSVLQKSNVELPPNDKVIKFIANDTMHDSSLPKYITFGKGYPK